MARFAVAKDPYAVLGVEPGSSVEEIRAAYRQRARSEHPDISDAPDAQEGGGGPWGGGVGVISCWMVWEWSFGRF
jgi:hypothetical protein